MRLSGASAPEHAGLAKGKYRDQLNAFTASLADAEAPDVTPPKNWMDAFYRIPTSDSSLSTYNSR